MFGDRLKRFREERSLSQEALAGRLGVSRVTVIRWENGTAKPSRTAAAQLEAIGFGPIHLHETNVDEIPQLKLKDEQLSLFEEASQEDDQVAEFKIKFGKKSQSIEPAPYVRNGPRNQLPLFEELYRLQGMHPKTCATAREWAERLSAVQTIPGVISSTSQYRLESPLQKAVHWNPKYGSHGWHRYIGRFPPHLVRALLNHFQATRHTSVLDPFSGSGTTLVECRLLGIPGIGIEICPLSALLSRVKSTFPTDPSALLVMGRELKPFYHEGWDQFARGREIDEIPHEHIIQRKGNLLPPFPNCEKWFTPRALLGVSLILEFAKSQHEYKREALLLALSSKMRSIGNVDVDVARAEYSQTPRQNVDVITLVLRALATMQESIHASVLSHKGSLGDSNSIRVIHDDALSVELPEDSIDCVITSPPYGVESSSYLRAHLLSYRCLYPFLGEDPYKFGEKVIGSEYVKETDVVEPDHRVGAFSLCFRDFFQGCLASGPNGKIIQRAYMMMQFFTDIDSLVTKLAAWIKGKGKVAFVIGNKKIGDHLIPAHEIIGEIFAHRGFAPLSILRHKLKCNNTNSQVPWQERVIQDEYVLFFERRKRGPR